MEEFPNIISFDKWVELNGLSGEIESVDCIECRGTGEIECVECGSDIECGYCDGTGEIGEPVEIEEYNLKVSEDRKKWREIWKSQKN